MEFFRLKQVAFLLVLVIFLPLLWQCGGPAVNPAYVRDGVEYGKVTGSFRHRWWNYYERGVSFSNGRFFQEAVRDFEEAISQRDKDQRMARTYGMHFIDYFPHRELGIVFYETEELEQAKQALERSISTFPSAKAYFYLDRVRKALIEQTKKDITLPVLSLDIQEKEIWTRQDPVVISGVAEDDHFVKQVMVQNIPCFQVSARKKVVFEQPLDLDQGSHTIRVTAKNLFDRAVQKDVIVHVDRQGPVLSLEKLESKETLEGYRLTVAGWIDDPAGVAGLTINNRKIDVKEGRQVYFHTSLLVTEKMVTFALEDVLKNQTQNTIPLASLSALRLPVMVADSSNADTKGLLAGLLGAKDKRPPVIHLKEWEKKQTIFVEKAYIEGRVMDENPIAGVTINGIPVNHRKGQIIFFSHLVPIEVGENHLVMEAMDEKGNQQTRHITIVRKIPGALRLSQRLTVSALPFQRTGISYALKAAFLDSMTNDFVSRRRFRMIERQKLDVVLQEQKIGTTDLIDHSTAVKLGRLVAAHTIMTGRMIESRQGIEIVARLIDTETTDILSTQDVFGVNKDLTSINHLAQGISLKFHRDFPVLKGQVMAKRGMNIFTDLGQGNVKLQRRIIVYRDQEPENASSGHSIGSDQEIIGQARIIQVMEQMSKAQLSRKNGDVIKALDKVITK